MNTVPILPRAARLAAFAMLAPLLAAASGAIELRIARPGEAAPRTFRWQP